MPIRKRVMIVVMMVVGLLFVASVALAQELSEPEVAVDDAIGAAVVLAAIHFAAGPLVKIVDRVKKWFKLTGGEKVTAVSIVLGSGIAWVLNLDPFPALNDVLPAGLVLRDFHASIGYIVAGIWMAMRAGYLNDEQEAAKLGAGMYVVPDAA